MCNTQIDIHVPQAEDICDDWFESAFVYNGQMIRVVANDIKFTSRMIAIRERAYKNDSNVQSL
jgi:hypothetical protein